MSTNETKTPQINDEVYVARHGSWSTQYAKGRVVKVTTTGQVLVQLAASETPVRFNNNGCEMGREMSARYLRTDVAAVEAELARIQAQRDTNRKVSELLAKFNNHKTGMGDYCINAEVKAELVALVNAL